MEISAIGLPPGAAPSQVNSRTLTQDDFLKVMIAELQQQDPFQASEGTALLEQFMTMGNFDAMQNMSQSMEAMVAQSNAFGAQNLVGRFVQGVSESGEAVSGTVDLATVRDGEWVFEVNGSTLKADGIRSVQVQPTTT